ncbi:uncharacterized protein LOC112588680 [Harpegnathos saltator]|uniref:uncharacterized protein LOC112588680 n=1 Tax=Harpegnathos saltator TaxID=610380 RepID=UPI000DBED61C|nr:uncharacterized protein LOC112588680 [Harpegnathos saltator]
MHYSYLYYFQIFEIKSNGFPGVIGVIDGCHIPCKQSVGNFYNRKGFHSIILQGICDHTMRFTDVFIGMSGHMHDARVFRNSQIFHRLFNQPLYYHIIGDSAYPIDIVI